VVPEDKKSTQKVVLMGECMELTLTCLMDIMHEEEINMELKNTFTNRWGMSLTAIAKSQMGIA
jgi:hypothetical protein